MCSPVSGQRALLDDQPGEPGDGQPEQHRVGQGDGRHADQVATQILDPEGGRGEQGGRAQDGDPGRADRGRTALGPFADGRHRGVQRGGAEQQVARQPDRVEVVPGAVAAALQLQHVDRVGGQRRQHVAGEQQERRRPAAAAEQQPHAHREQGQVEHRVGQRGDLDQGGRAQLGLRRDQIEPGEHRRGRREGRRVQQARQVPTVPALPDQDDQPGRGQRIVRQVEDVGECRIGQIAEQVVGEVEVGVGHRVHGLTGADQSPGQGGPGAVSGHTDEHRDRRRGADRAVEHDPGRRQVGIVGRHQEVGDGDQHAEHQVAEPGRGRGTRGAHCCHLPVSGSGPERDIHAVTPQRSHTLTESIKDQGLLNPVEEIGRGQRRAAAPTSS